MTVERRLTGIGQWVGRWEVRSDRVGKDGKPVMYIVSKTSDNRFGCSCPAWKFQKTGQRKDCKHIDELKRTIGLVSIGVRIKTDDFETVLRDVASRSEAFERALQDPPPQWKADPSLSAVEAENQRLRGRIVELMNAEGRAPQESALAGSGEVAARRKFRFKK